MSDTRLRDDEMMDDMSMDDDWRQDWQSRYGTSGRRYEDYEPHYRYGSETARSGRYQGRSWEDCERDVQKDWTDRFQDGWDDFKDSVRRGWESVTGRR
jgi:hypothetical protein